MRAVGHHIQQLLKPLAKQLGFQEGEVLRQWPAIVGPALVGRVQPRRLKQGALVVAVTDGATALEVSYAAPQLIERINSFMGFAAVQRVLTEQTLVGRAPAAKIGEH